MGLKPAFRGFQLPLPERTFKMPAFGLPGHRQRLRRSWRLADYPHSLSPGQYNLCLRDSCGTCTPAENGDVVIVSRGYIPAQSGSRVMRQVKLEVDIGSLTNAVQTQAADPDNISAGLFNSSSANNFPPAAPIHNPTRIEGTISAGHYEGDADVTPDEIGIDYDPQPAPILPDDNNNPEDDIRDFTASYPSILMQYFYDNATNYWPLPSRVPPITATAILSTLGNNQYLDVSAGFFTGMLNAVVKRVGSGNNWWQGDGGSASDWKVINQVSMGDARARIATDPLQWVNWPDENLATPAIIEVTIKLARRFYQNSALQRWYVGGQGETADALIDLRNDNDIDFDGGFSIVAEGDIVIKGTGRIRMRFNGLPPSAIRYPNLATQDGRVFSTDPPSGGSEMPSATSANFKG